MKILSRRSGNRPRRTTALSVNTLIWYWKNRLPNVMPATRLLLIDSQDRTHICNTIIVYGLILLPAYSTCTWNTDSLHCTYLYHGLPRIHIKVQKIWYWMAFGPCTHFQIFLSSTLQLLFHSSTWFLLLSLYFSPHKCLWYCAFLQYRYTTSWWYV